MKTFEPMAGSTIDSAIRKAIGIASEHGEPCEFEFNGTKVTVNASSDPATVQKQWSDDMEANRLAYLASPEYAAAVERRKQEAEQERRDFAAQVVSLKILNEEGLRDLKLKWPVTVDELNSVIDALSNRPHDYGTAVYAMSIAATATYYYMSHVVGSSGFQASCADLDILRRTRSYEGPFALLKAEDMLYPQYDERIAETQEKWQPWLAERAAKLLNENGHAHPDVKARWRELAERVVA